MKTAPDPIYVQEFLFKQSNISQVFDFKTPIPAACNLLVSDKKRGLLYIGHDDKIIVLKPAEENNAEWKIELQLPGIISKIAINCDYNYIAVAIALKSTILIFDAQSLVRNNFNLLLEITSSNKLDSYVTDIRWNPTVPTMLCTVTNDCSIGSFQLKIETENTVSKISVHSKVIANELQALCAAWSPKGKQIAVGCKNGDILQLKPDLKLFRIIAGPSPPIGEVISILWISNYQFCAAYANNERHINVLIVDAPKGETKATFTCYEDITYGCADAEEENIPRYYFEHVPEWGLIIAGSSTSSEIAVLGTIDGGVNWNQWQLVDSGRAQLPLMRTTEIYPIGLAIDKSSTNILPWGVDSTLPYPVPILHILGTSGRLCSFHMVNLAPNCVTINSPPIEIVTPPSHSIASEISFSINAAITSTPRSKQVEVMPERPKPTPIGNIFGESLKGTGFFQQPVEQPIEQPKLQEKPVLIATTKPIMPSTETPVSEPVTKPEVKLMDKEVNLSQTVEQKSSIDDSIRMQAFLQEQTMFEKELRNRLLQPQVWECGTDEEKKRLGDISTEIETFLREELKDTTNSLSSDIAYLKALLLQSFAWVEETKSKNAANTDISTRNCSENSKLTDLRHWYYYTQTQLNQVSKILDLEWSDHKAQKKIKMKIPSLEFVYQNLLIHSKIFAKEKEKFEQILRRWKSLNRSLPCTTVNVSSLNRSMASLHVSSPKLSSTIREKNDIMDTRCKTIALKTLNFTHEKQLKLKALLTESHPRVIKPVNPSPIQDRLKATLSSLAALNPTIAETKTKAEEPSALKQNITINQQTVEKQTKSQNPLASLNSIVARIGSSDTNDIIQNKVQQKPLPMTTSFSAAISSKQMEKKPTIAATALASQSKPKQDFTGISFPSSITFGTTQKSQDVLFSKSPFMDTTAKSIKEPTTNDNILKTPESTSFSTGILKDALSTEYPLSTDSIARNLSPLSVASAVKSDSAVTFSFATSNVTPNLAKNTSALDTAMSFASKPMTHTPTAELSATTQMQASIDLSTLSSVLGSSNSLTLPSNSADGKINTITSSMSFAPAPIVTTQAPVMTAAPTPITNIGDLTVSLAPTNSNQKSTQPTSVADNFIIEKAAEVKTLNFGSISIQNPNSLSATPIFGGQTVAKSMVSEATTTLPTTTIFGAAAFPSIAPTFGTSTSAPTASVFSGFTNSSVGSNTPVSSAASPVSSTASPFQNKSTFSLNKPTFGEINTVSTSQPATSFGIDSNNTSAGTISFGSPLTAPTTTTTTTTTTVVTTMATVSPSFGSIAKSSITSPTSNAFSNAQTPASSATVFGTPISSPTSTPFDNTSGSVFSNMPVTSSSTTIFGGSSMNSVFGSNPLSSTSGNIFGGNSTGFGTSTSGSIFDTNASKSGIMFGGATNAAPTSPFGNTTSNASSMATGASATGVDVFRSTVTNTSPIQQSVLSNQSTFGQAPTFGTKPMFGSSPIFGGSKPVFGGSTFGSPPTFESSNMGFGSPSAMQSSTMENMSKVFGEVAGSSTFESLANQSGGLSFGSLAQKSSESEKPTFTAGSSFSSWR